MVMAVGVAVTGNTKKREQPPQTQEDEDDYSPNRVDGRDAFDWKLAKVF
jgi:hypothetical protein